MTTIPLQDFLQNSADQTIYSCLEINNTLTNWQIDRIHWFYDVHEVLISLIGYGCFELFLLILSFLQKNKKKSSYVVFLYEQTTKHAPIIRVAFWALIFYCVVTMGSL